MSKRSELPSSIYEVYMPSFKDSDGDGLGDLGGVIEELDYLKDLGIKSFKLSPFWKSPWKDGGYDISSHLEIQPEYGDKETLGKLIDEAHKRDIKVMCDFVPNHTSTEHPWFVEARKSKDNPFRDYFVWKDPKGADSDGKPLPPNNWLSEFDGGSAWTYDKTTGQYYYHNFSTHQPDLNFTNPVVMEEQVGILRSLLDMGFDGVRVDAVKYFDKDPKFRDEPLNPKYKLGIDNPYREHLHEHTSNRPGIFKVIKGFADAVREYPDKFMVSESYTDTDEEKSKYYDLCGNDRHTLYNFDLISEDWKAEKWKKRIDSFMTSRKPGDIPAFNLGNHDRKRLATRVGGENQARVAGLVHLTLPGMPILYNGEELGMVDTHVPQDKVRDVLGKNVPGHGRDGARTPMQWTAGEYAGFSTSEPFQYLGSDYKTRNVEAQKKDPKSILNLYKKLLSYRNENGVLQEGSYKSIDTPRDVLGYEREYEGKKIVVLANFSGEQQNVSLDYPEAKLLLKTSLDKEGTIVNFTEGLDLAPNEGYLFSIADF